MAYLMTFVSFYLLSSNRQVWVLSLPSAPCNAHRGPLRRGYTGRSVKLTTPIQCRDYEGVELYLRFPLCPQGVYTVSLNFTCMHCYTVSLFKLSAAGCHFPYSRYRITVGTHSTLQMSGGT